MEINFSPAIPKTDVDTFVELIISMEDAASNGRLYLKSGNIVAARHMMNARMRLKSLGTKVPLPKMEGKIVAGIHPLTAEDRGRALTTLEERDGSIDV